MIAVLRRILQAEDRGNAVELSLTARAEHRLAKA
jgi:hypothetical protein